MTCSGDLDDAVYLTSLGLQMARRAVDGLSELFGPGCLVRAANPTKPQDRIDLSALSLSLFGPSPTQRRAFGGLLSLWARLQLLVDSHAGGIGALRKLDSVGELVGVEVSC